MVRPFTVSLDLFRGAAYHPYARRTEHVLATSALEACSKAETAMNLQLGDVEYAAASSAQPIWEPRPATPVTALALAA
jgi:hypothetical protein